MANNNNKNVTLTQLTTMDTTVKNYIQTKDGELIGLLTVNKSNLTNAIKEIKNDLDDVNATATTVDTTVDGMIGGATVTVSLAESNDTVEINGENLTCKTYTISQDDVEIATINVPVDLSVEEGAVISETDNNTGETTTYLKFKTTGANDYNLSLDVSSLVSGFSIQQDGILTLESGEITGELEDSSVENGNIINESIVEQKLSTELQEKVEKGNVANRDVEGLTEELETLNGLHKKEERQTYYNYNKNKVTFSNISSKTLNDYIYFLASKGEFNPPCYLIDDQSPTDTTPVIVVARSYDSKLQVVTNATYGQVNQFNAPQLPLDRLGEFFGAELSDKVVVKGYDETTGTTCNIFFDNGVIKNINLEEKPVFIKTLNELLNIENANSLEDEYDGSLVVSPFNLEDYYFIGQTLNNQRYVYSFLNSRFVKEEDSDVFEISVNESPKVLLPLEEDNFNLSLSSRLSNDEYYEINNNFTVAKINDKLTVISAQDKTNYSQVVGIDFTHLKNIASIYTFTDSAYNNATTIKFGELTYHDNELNTTKQLSEIMETGVAYGIELAYHTIKAIKLDNGQYAVYENEFDYAQSFYIGVPSSGIYKCTDVGNADLFINSTGQPYWHVNPSKTLVDSKIVLFEDENNNQNYGFKLKNDNSWEAEGDLDIKKEINNYTYTVAEEIAEGISDIPLATTTVNGLMPKEDVVALDGTYIDTINNKLYIKGQEVMLNSTASDSDVNEIIDNFLGTRKIPITDEIQAPSGYCYSPCSEEDEDVIGVIITDQNSEDFIENSFYTLIDNTQHDETYVYVPENGFDTMQVFSEFAENSVTLAKRVQISEIENSTEDNESPLITSNPTYYTRAYYRFNNQNVKISKSNFDKTFYYKSQWEGQDLYDEVTGLAKNDSVAEVKKYLTNEGQTGNSLYDVDYPLENFTLQEEYEQNKANSGSSGSLTKSLSELPVGALVKDTSTTYNGEPIIWRVLEHGHDGDPSGSTTLEARDIISLKCFDAKEPNNSNSDRQNYGNNRYSDSNLLQWLNSNETIWYTAQHGADQAPDSEHVGNVFGIPVNPYSTEAGFLTNFSENLRNALQTVTKRTVLNTVTDGGSYEEVQSKLFLLSTTEVGLANENNIAEGSIYNYYSTDGTNRRKKNLANEAVKGNHPYAASPWYWGLRTPYTGYSYKVRIVDGNLNSTDVYDGGYGISPAICTPSSLKVSATAGADGIYVLDWNPSSNGATHLTSKRVPGVVQISAVKFKDENAEFVDINNVATDFVSIRNLRKLLTNNNVEYIKVNFNSEVCVKDPSCYPEPTPLSAEDAGKTRTIDTSTGGRAVTVTAENLWEFKGKRFAIRLPKLPDGSTATESNGNETLDHYNTKNPYEYIFWNGEPYVDEGADEYTQEWVWAYRGIYKEDIGRTVWVDKGQLTI